MHIYLIYLFIYFQTEKSIYQNEYADLKFPNYEVKKWATRWSDEFVINLLIYTLFVILGFIVHC